MKDSVLLALAAVGALAAGWVLAVAVALNTGWGLRVVLQ